MLKKVLPAGQIFPIDFGFIPGTIGEDGDPLDALVMSEFKTLPGCLMECRLFSAVLAKQKERENNSPTVIFLYQSYRNNSRMGEYCKTCQLNCRKKRKLFRDL
ncbi:MAG: inorganic diphosphatase [Bacteroidota bacterium]